MEENKSYVGLIDFAIFTGASILLGSQFGWKIGLSIWLLCAAFYRAPSA